MILQNLLEIYGQFSSRRKLEFFLLIILMLVGVFAEIASIGLVLPLIAVLSGEESSSLSDVVELILLFSSAIGIDNKSAGITAVFLGVILLSSLLKIITLRYYTWFVFSVGHEISSKVYSKILGQNYKYHLSLNSSKIISTVTMRITSFMFDALLPAVIIINTSVIILCVCAALLLFNWMVAVIGSVPLVVAYVLIAKRVSKSLREHGENINSSQSKLVKEISEGLGSIRDVLLNDKRDYYKVAFDRIDSSLRRSQGVNLFLGGSPRFVIEAVGAATIAILAFYLSESDDKAMVMPTLGAFALAAQKLIPAMQQWYNSWGLLVSSRPIVEEVLKFLRLNDYSCPEIEKNISFERSITIQNLKFQYYGAESGSFLINIPSLDIPKGCRLGIIGATGSGKSTALDLMTTLLKPDSGLVMVDGVEIDSTTELSWRKKIAYVSQSSFFSDLSVVENIASGMPIELIDVDKVVRSAKKAGIYDHICSLNQGFQTTVGEKGQLFSGGQLQRLSLARAFYKDFEILVLDEFTSAMDVHTEAEIMNAIYKLPNSVTVIMIAHRLYTLTDCDYIVEFEKGSVKRLISDANDIAKVCGTI